MKETLEGRLKLLSAFDFVNALANGGAGLELNTTEEEDLADLLAATQKRRGTKTSSLEPKLTEEQNLADLLAESLTRKRMATTPATVLQADDDAFAAETRAMKLPNLGRLALKVHR